MAQVYFYFSAMNAGKTTQMLQAAFNYRERNMNVLVYKPSVDTRDGTNTIRSRIGLDSFCNIIKPTTDLYRNLMVSVSEQTKLGKPVSCILIDEVQFLTDEQIKDIFYFKNETGIPVMCYGIRTDFQGELFPGSARLLAWAEKLIEIKGICKCGAKATHVVRYDDAGNVLLDGEQLSVGGNDVYTSYCFKHWLEETKR